MHLILWRHADAEDVMPGGPDAERRLTEKGEKQAQRMAKWLSGQLPDGVRIVASPARRAQQTARALAKNFESSDAVATRATPQSVLEAAGWPDGEGAVVVVGHQPTLGRAAALALTGRADDWSVRKGGVWWLESRGRRGVIVRAVVAPDLI